MKITKNMKVGDIYLNPVMEDLWILRQDYIEDLDHEQWILQLIHSDYTEDYRCVKGFIKLGNIYEVFGRINNAMRYIKEHTYDDSVDGDGTSLIFEKANAYDLLKILRGDQIES